MFSPIWAFGGFLITWIMAISLVVKSFVSGRLGFLTLVPLWTSLPLLEHLHVAPAPSHRGGMAPAAAVTCHVLDGSGVAAVMVGRMVFHLARRSSHLLMSVSLTADSS